jgi:hypothetical protein
MKRVHMDPYYEHYVEDSMDPSAAVARGSLQ